VPSSLVEKVPLHPAQELPNFNGNYSLLNVSKQQRVLIEQQTRPTQHLQQVNSNGFHSTLNSRAKQQQQA
jgi:hypothetical protein